MPRYRGRHRAPTTRGRTAARVAIVGAVAATPAVVLAPQASAATSDFDVIAECESGNRNIESVSTASSASGYFQIVDGTWRSAGGTQFAVRALGATRGEQLIVAQRIAARRGSYADWNPSRACWGGKVSGASVAASVRVEVPAAKPGRHRAVEVDASASGTYVVRSGDTLSRIAATHGQSWRELAARNADVVHDPNLIFPGQRLDV